MIADLIAIGLFSAQRYDTPPSRVIVVPAYYREVKLPPKLDQEAFDYCLDWTARIDGDEIASAAVDVPSGAIVPSRTIYDATSTSFWLAGGRPGNGSTVRCVITTAGGRTFEQLMSIRCL